MIPQALSVTVKILHYPTGGALGNGMTSIEINSDAAAIHDSAPKVLTRTYSESDNTESECYI